MKVENIEVILVNPKYPENIGAVCRAMKTMGIKSLSIVSNTVHDFDKIKILAVHAADIAEKAVYYKSLPEAVKKAELVAGISRRRGKKRKYFALTPEELAAVIHKNPSRRVALIFGNEETGLTEDELASCNLLVNIPAAPEFPSLNLSHAVQIITYSIYRECRERPFTGYRPISAENLEHLVSIITHSLHNIGFFSVGNINEFGVYFRDILARSGLTTREAKRMEEVFRKISGIVANKGIEL